MLEHIQYVKCPVCGSDIRCMRKENQHTNGHWNEHIEFRCGHKLSFSPNYMRVEVKRKCHRDPESIKENNAREKANGLLVRYVKRMNVTDDYKKRILGWLDHALY